jgi:mRNA interferase RelE/StbE
MKGRYTLELAAAAGKSLHRLPDKVAFAALEFINGPLLDNPRRVGKPLDEPLAPAWSARRGEYRVIYTIDDDRVVVQVIRIAHRSDAYRG